ncbi:MAG TPA: T9SS type A sorting domain-containing protein [Bacteroidia bacterium]|nr:T9SS type A sorting domain-containing protein [Bacteroidia bacterium]
MKKIIFGILFLGYTGAHAQSLDRKVVASSGAYTQGAGINLSSTIGEVSATTLAGASSFLTQGFQQPDGLFVGIVDQTTGHVNWNAYPNPVSSTLTLELSSSKNESLVIICHDILGRTVTPIYNQSLIAGETTRLQLDVHHLVPAMYFVRVSRKNDDRPIETIRIIKSH